MYTYALAQDLNKNNKISINTVTLEIIVLQRNISAELLHIDAPSEEFILLLYTTPTPTLY